MKSGLLYLFFLCALLKPVESRATRIDKGYTALRQYDYFKAKKYFSKALKYNECVAAQGLAIIYYRKDNPFHNYDSALVYINRSIDSWDSTKLRKKEKYAEYGFTMDSIVKTRALISSSIYYLVVKEGSIEAYNEFIATHVWAKEKEAAIYSRDSLAFFTAVFENTSNAYQDFMETYPRSEFYDIASQNYYDAQFIESTGDGSLESFVSFVEANPDNPLREVAENKIFELVTSDNEISSFENFIAEYPSNRNIRKAWEMYFQLYLGEGYTQERIEAFLEKNLNTPIRTTVEYELMYYDITMLPVLRSEKFGYMDLSGFLIFGPQYDYASFFKEGLASVTRNDKQGVINKQNKLLIPFSYDVISEFSNGLAVVELNDKLGMIDRNGTMILDCIYDDIGNVSEGMVYASLGDKYGYYNIKGELIVDHIYDDASDFSNGLAKVSLEEKEGFITTSGEIEIPLNFSSVRRLTDSVFVYENDGMFGLMDYNGRAFIDPVYNEIGELSEGLAIAVEGDKLVYIDERGKVMIDHDYQTYPNYMLKGEFHDSVAIAMNSEGRYGRISIDNKVLTKFKYENLGIGKKFIPYQQETKWGIMNASGKTVITPAYQSLVVLHEDRILAVKNDTMGLIKATGQVEIPFLYSDIVLLTDELFLVKQNDQFGVYKAGELMIPVKYDQIGLFEEDFLYLLEEGELKYYSLISDKWVKIEEESRHD